MLKLTIPDVPDLHAPLVNHDRVTSVVALSGGYTRVDACKRLSANHGMIASFSRALAEDLRHSMSDAAFEAASSPWAEGPRDARGRPASALSGGHAKGSLGAFGKTSCR
jgi:fructose-bisphosphate aldolase class 1